MQYVSETIDFLMLCYAIPYVICETLEFKSIYYILFSVYRAHSHYILRKKNTYFFIKFSTKESILGVIFFRFSCYYCWKVTFQCFFGNFVVLDVFNSQFWHKKRKKCRENAFLALEISIFRDRKCIRITTYFPLCMQFGNPFALLSQNMIALHMWWSRTQT